MWELEKSKVNDINLINRKITGTLHGDFFMRPEQPTLIFIPRAFLFSFFGPPFPIFTQSTEKENRERWSLSQKKKRYFLSPHFFCLENPSPPFVFLISQQPVWDHDICPAAASSHTADAYAHSHTHARTHTKCTQEKNLT